jgi:phospholipid transport system substrate-binding protein
MKIVARGIRSFAVLFALAAGAPSVAAAADVVAPDALVKTTVSEVLSVIKQNKDKRALHDLAEKKVLPHFDFRQMTQLAVGRSWREASPEQRKKLEDGFRGLLVSTYTTALTETATSDAKVDVKPAAVKPDQTEVTVRTVAKQSGRQPVAIDYRMNRTADGWKVYDVVVENLSLVNNYRGSFNSEISRSGIDGLIKTLEAKNKQLAES